jgi:ribosomal protein S12 methylthiotransferase
MRQQSRISLERNRARVGSTLKVLVEGPSEETDLLLQGRGEHQAPGIDGVVLINEGSAVPGSFADVEILEAHPYDLVGRIAGPRTGLNSPSP